MLKFFDGLVNYIMGLGIAGRDKTASSVFGFTELTQEQLESAYRGSWIARKIIDIPADDMTREWRDWQAGNPEIEAIEETEKVFNVRAKVHEALKMARLYGGSAIVLGVKDSVQDVSTELRLDSITAGSLRFLHVVNRFELAHGPLIMDVESPWYGEPEYYQRVGMTANVTEASKRIHPSRLIKFIGAPLPNKWRVNSPWGDSILQVVDDAVKEACMVNRSLAQLVSELKYDVVSTPQLSTTLADEEATRLLIKRMEMNNTMKSLSSTLLIDKEEKWEVRQANLAGLPDVINIFFFVVCGAADIPATRFFGQSPTGMNATGESDTRNHYDRIKSEQTNDLQPRIAMLDEVLLRHTFGSRDKSIFYLWTPLWQISDKERGELDKAKAETAKIDADTGLVPFEVLAVARVNQLIEDGTYPGLESAVEEFENDGGVIGEREENSNADPNADPSAGAAAGSADRDGQQQEQQEQQTATA